MNVKLFKEIQNYITKESCTWAETANASESNDTASNLPTSNPAPILTSVLAAVHKDAFANDISGEVVQQSRNYRTLIDGRQVVEQRQAQQALALFGGVAIFTVELTKVFPRRATVQRNVMKHRHDFRFFQKVNQRDWSIKVRLSETHAIHSFT